MRRTNHWQYAIRAAVGALLASLALSGIAQGATSVRDGVGFDFSTISGFVEDQKTTTRIPFELTREQKVRHHRLQLLAHRFRRIAVADPTLLMPAYALKNPLVLADLVASGASAHVPGIWRFFFFGSIVHVGRVAAPVSRIGFYNPHADGWVMTDWRWAKRRPVLVGVHVLTGEAMRGERVEALLPVAWNRSPNTPTAISNAVGLGSIAFAKAHPILSAKVAPNEARRRLLRAEQVIIEIRLIACLRNLVKHRKTPGYASITNTLVTAVRSGDAASLKGLTKGVGEQALYRVTGLPKFVRANLELSAAVPVPGGAVVTFGVPMISRWMVMALYRNGPKDGAAVIGGLAVVDLGASPRRQGDGR